MTAHATRLFLYLAAGLLGLATSATAEVEVKEQWYEVEVIVFAHTAPSIDSEVWPVEPGRPRLEEAVSLRRPRPGSLVDFGRLEEEELELQQTWDHLKRAQDQRPIAHFGWRQLGLGRGQAEAVRISVDRPDPVTLQRANGDGTLTRAPAPDRLLQGTVRLVMERYLHLESDLVYQPILDEPARHDPPEPQRWNEPEEAAPDRVFDAITGFFARDSQPQPREREPGEYLRLTRDGRVLWPFRMNQKRRMRSGEVHYLDHPLFGLLVVARPYEPPKGGSAATSTGETAKR